MIEASEFLRGCLERGFTFFTGTPCSYLKPLINNAIDDEQIRFLCATNEGDAVALASGVTVAGGKAVVMFQNSGLGNAVNPLTSLAFIFKIPLLLLITHRGEPGGEKDEPQHELMGAITTELLNILKIGWSSFPRTSEEIQPALDRAEEWMRREERPYAFVVRKKDVAEYTFRTAPSDGKTSFDLVIQEEFASHHVLRPSRSDALRVIQQIADRDTVIVATTGYTGRELYSLHDRENQFSMVGSMGCALPFGLGIALQKPSVRVVVVDGDGALLMRTGTMGTVGSVKPHNLLHVLLDNEAHDSTGGQRTVSRTVSFTAIARGFGYAEAFSAETIEEFKAALERAAGLHGPVFIHLKIRCGTLENLPRPARTPVEMKARVMNYLSHS